MRFVVPLAIGACLVACPALAQSPCSAPVTGYHPGETIRGQVVRVVDGDGLWVSMGPGAGRCIKIRIADFFAPEMDEPGGERARQALQKLAGGKVVVCTARRGQGGSTRSYQRLIASCTVDGRGLGDSMRKAGVKEGGRGR